jgi:hypothetical protein
MRKVIGLILILFQIILLISVFIGLVPIDIFFIILLASFMGTFILYFVLNKQENKPQ